MQNNYVLDVNIWVSVFISGKISILVQLIIEHNITIYVSNELLEELSEVLVRPKFKKYLNNAVASYVYLAKNISTLMQAERKYNKAPDADDNYLYDLCLHTKSTLVTGDKTLLAYTAKPPVKTITYKTFLEPV